MVVAMEKRLSRPWSEVWLEAPPLPEKDENVHVTIVEEGEDDEESVVGVKEKGREEEAFSIWSPKAKKLLVLIASLACFSSPLSSNIYFPAINTIAADLNVSAVDIDLSITTYLIVQGVAPMMVAGFSDNAGRRPAYVICFVLFIAANLALALQHSYPALMVLRALQSAGSSGTVALASGIVGDLATTSERGMYMSIAALGQLLGPCLAPLVGGLIAQYAGWRSIFWFLFIFSVVLFIPLLLFFPETCRNIVGNGSVAPPTPNMSLTDYLRVRRANRAMCTATIEEQRQLRRNYKLHFPNPLSTLVVLADKESAIVLSSLGLAMACFYAITTAAATQFRDTYGFDDLQISLMFIPLGVGGICSAFSTGKLIDWNYRRHAKRQGISVVYNKAHDLSNFPIEKVRLQIAMPIFVVGSAATLTYGWVMYYKVSLAAPIIVLFIIGLAGMAVFQVLNILLVDIYPGKSATASAANNLVRCELGALASAIVVPLIDHIGSGWTFTIAAFVSLLWSQLLWLVISEGPRWRRERKEKLARGGKQDLWLKMEEWERRQEEREKMYEAWERKHEAMVRRHEEWERRHKEWEMKLADLDHLWSVRHSSSSSLRQGLPHRR